MDRLHILLYNIRVNVLKSEYKYETKNIKVGLVGGIYVEAIMTIPLAALIKNI